MRVGGTGLFAAAIALVATGSSALADVEAKFLGKSTYSTARGCQMLKALAAGATRNLNTVPQTLDATGYHSWEGGCEIERIAEQVKGKRWLVALHCHEGAASRRQHETWERAPDGALLVTLDKKKYRYTQCPVVPAPGKKQ